MTACCGWSISALTGRRPVRGDARPGARSPGARSRRSADQCGHPPAPQTNPRGSHRRRTPDACQPHCARPCDELRGGIASERGACDSGCHPRSPGFRVHRLLWNRRRRRSRRLRRSRRRRLRRSRRRRLRTRHSCCSSRAPARSGTPSNRLVAAHDDRVRALDGPAHTVPAHPAFTALSPPKREPHAEDASKYEPNYPDGTPNAANPTSPEAVWRSALHHVPRRSALLLVRRASTLPTLTDAPAASAFWPSGAGAHRCSASRHRCHLSFYCPV